MKTNVLRDMGVTAEQGAESGAPRATPSDEAAALVVRFGQALHRFGTPADRVEAAMTELSRRLHLRAEFFALPTSLHAAFGEPGRQSTFLVRMAPTGEVELGRLSALDRLAMELGRGDVSVVDAAARLEAILSAPPRHARWAMAIAFAFVSAATARILGGGLPEIAMAAVLGHLVGLASTGLVGGPRFAPVVPAIAGFVVSLSAGLLAAAGLTPAPWSVTLASIVVLLPGLTLTLAMREVATGHLAAGSARSVGAAATFLALGCGIALGDHVATELGSHGALVLRAATHHPLPAFTEPLALLVAALAFVVLFQAEPRDLPVIVLAAAIAWAGARVGTELLDARLAPLFGATALGVAGNVFARLRDRPAAIVLVPGLILLVPGSLGARSLSALLSDDVVGGVETAFTMAFVAAALVCGLLLANAIVAPRRAL
jgi:uncharacterized membrane protein YjjP (DUF1212 family)